VNNNRYCNQSAIPTKASAVDLKTLMYDIHKASSYMTPGLAFKFIGYGAYLDKRTVMPSLTAVWTLLDLFVQTRVLKLHFWLPSIQVGDPMSGE